ncbi:MAG: winged helix-turn-helix transcriptional regulator [Clostridia bacterium]|nr:winged helix-turn-helix transcriptional regulator [Clostridia bacterium]
MLIVSGDEVFSFALRQYLEDSDINASVLDRCVLVDLDFSSGNVGKGTVTFSRDEKKNPDLVRPFLMKDLERLVRTRFSGDNIDYASKEEDIFLSADGVTYKGIFTPLTPKEHDLLALLVSNRGRALSREDIYKQLWNDDTANSNVVDVYIRYLRKKLDFHFGERIIYTRRGCGYYIK